MMKCNCKLWSSDVIHVPRTETEKEWYVHMCVCRIEWYRRTFYMIYKSNT